MAHDGATVEATLVVISVVAVDTAVVVTVVSWAVTLPDSSSAAATARLSWFIMYCGRAVA